MIASSFSPFNCSTDHHKILYTRCQGYKRGYLEAFVAKLVTPRNMTSFEYFNQNNEVYSGSVQCVSRYCYRYIVMAAEPDRLRSFYDGQRGQSQRSLRSRTLIHFQLL